MPEPARVEQPAAPTEPRRPTGVFGAAAVLTFGVLVAGMFALPLNSYRGVASDVGFVQVRNTAALFGNRTIEGHRVYSALAHAWWQWAAFVAAGLLLLTVCAMVLAPWLRWLGGLLAVIAAAGGVLHGLSMAQSADPLSVQLPRGNTLHDTFDHAGAGVWVSLVGFALLAAVGVTRGLTGRAAKPAAQAS